MDLINESSESEESTEESSEIGNNTAANLSKTNNKKQVRKDYEENTIFVGNLPNQITNSELKKLFRTFGPILHARLRCAVRKELKTPKKLAVIKKEFHEDNGYINAFIKFKTSESCKAALKMNGKLYEEHHLRVTLAENKINSNPRGTIFLGNLPFKIQDDDVWKAFEDCGPIDSVRLIRDSKTGIGKGFGYVNFKSADSVELALKLNGLNILDRDIRVIRAVSEAKKMPKTVKKKIKLKPAQGKQISKQERSDKVKKPYPKVRDKNDFQGQKTKPSMQNKSKKKKKFDKKKVAIKRIAEGMMKKA